MGRVRDTAYAGGGFHVNLDFVRDVKKKIAGVFQAPFYVGNHKINGGGDAV